MKKADTMEGCLVALCFEGKISKTVRDDKKLITKNDYE